ncbi:nucleotidyltransferase family protein [Actimicrobium antarcticum]|uniref:MobA-like NTP transferase domain-containing protein n=1 Tax=Actimicrobium antarcticum TaxID=1051899 RepID=A0ABP7T834_9BURK
MTFPEPSTNSFAAVVLAAGNSSRMAGRHKLLLPVGDEPALRRTVRALLDAGPAEVVVVTGFNAAAVSAALHGLPVRFTHNPRWQEGQMTSVASGIAALQVPCSTIMVCLADQILLAADDYTVLARAFAARASGSIMVPQFAGQRGNPVLFAASHADSIVAGERNLGCRKLIDDNPDQVVAFTANHDRYTTDMDTPQDYERLLARLGLTP